MTIFRYYLVTNTAINIIEMFETREVEPPTDKKLMEQTLAALESFEFAFQNMQKADSPTLHLAIWNLAKLETSIGKWPNRMKCFGRIVIESLKKKWLAELNHGHVLSIALHPNYKSLDIFNNAPILNSLKNVTDIHDSILAVAHSIGIGYASIGNENDEPDQQLNTFNRGEEDPLWIYWSNRQDNKIKSSNLMYC